MYKNTIFLIILMLVALFELSRGLDVLLDFSMSMVGAVCLYGYLARLDDHKEQSAASKEDEE